MAEDQVGVIIEKGPSDWQIIQQDSTGVASVSLSGRWVGVAGATVQVRIVSQDSQIAPLRSLDWQDGQTREDGTWDAIIAGIPAGGLYRIETRLFTPGTAGEWSTRGDMRHFIGVGDLWVIAGQSNSAGYGRGPILDPPELGIHLYRNSETWMLAAHPLNESTDTAHVCNREGGNPAHSPYLAFARTLKQKLAYPIGLIQASLGGSPLSQWNPTEPGPSTLYENMIACIEHTGGKVKGVLWYQGESDCNLEQANSYEERFVKTVEAWRNRLAIPDLAVITVQLNRVYGCDQDEAQSTYWSIVREAQRQVARKQSGIVVVPTTDLTLSDGIHNGPAGNIVLGERMARFALNGVYHVEADALAPDLQQATLLDGDVIELSFSPVTSRIDTVNQQAHGFRVEDEAGVIPIQSVGYPQNNSVQLNLDRPISGTARVSGVWGVNPGTTAIDVERQIPILGFYGVEVIGK